jgi:hypothetical protein
MVMPRDGEMVIRAGDEVCVLQACRAALIPAGMGGYSLTGAGKVLNYYVPDLEEDVVRPLRAGGHGDASISQLGAVFSQ